MTRNTNLAKSSRAAFAAVILGAAMVSGCGRSAFNENQAAAAQAAADRAEAAALRAESAAGMTNHSPSSSSAETPEDNADPANQPPAAEETGQGPAGEPSPPAQ